MGFAKILRLRLVREKSNLIFAIAIIFLAPLVIFIYSSFKSYQLEIEKTRLGTQSLAVAVQGHTHDLFRSADNSLLEINTFLQDSDFLKKMGSKKLSFFLDEIAKRQSYTELIAICDSEGKYLANSAWTQNYDVLSKSTKTLAERPHFKKQKADPNAGLVITEPIKSNTTGNLVVALTRRLPSADASFKGVIVLAINVKKFSEFFAQIARGPNDAITLWNSDRILLARYPFSEAAIGKMVPMNPAMVPLIEAGKRFGTYDGKSTVDGVSRIFSYHLVDDYPFAVVVGTATDEALSSWARSALVMGLSGTMLAGLGIFLLLQYLESLRQAEGQKAIVAQASKMASLGEMASGIAHEINNPLAIISGKASQMITLIDSGRATPELLKAAALKINATAMRIAKIISGLRSFSRDTNADPLIPVPARTIIDNTLELSTERFKFGGVNLEIVGSTDAMLNCREAEISQVVLNLLNNAYDAVINSPEKWVKVVISEGDNQVFIKVMDSGSGIPPEIVEKIMMPFYTTKPIGQGTGLGLSISKGIIESHGGKFYLDSQIKNTTFVISLPKFIK